MRLALQCHPDTPCEAVTRIDVDVARTSTGVLTLRYSAAGAIAALRVPPPAPPARTDELWKHTCFEAFIRAPGSTAYIEFNFAPSTQWAAYRFSAPRTGMRAADDIADPRIAWDTSENRLALQATLALDRLPELSRDAPWPLALSAVIEETTGRKSNWALAHPPGRPDFHHPDCFAQEIAAASAP